MVNGGGEGEVLFEEDLVWKGLDEDLRAGTAPQHINTYQNGFLHTRGMRSESPAHFFLNLEERNKGLREDLMTNAKLLEIAGIALSSS